MPAHILLRMTDYYIPLSTFDELLVHLEETGDVVRREIIVDESPILVYRLITEKERELAFAAVEKVITQETKYE